MRRYYEDKMQKQTAQKVLAVTLICAPAIVLAFLIYLYGVDVPYWDQFTVVAVSASARIGTLHIPDLWAQTNESRLFFPNLLLIGLDFLTKGNIKDQMFVMVLEAILVLWNIYRLASLTLPSYWGRRLGVFLAALLIFSPIQWESWLMGTQVIVFMPILCLTTALVVCSSKRGPWTKLCMCAALCIVATYSFSNGMVCWVLLAGWAVLQFGTVQQRVKAAIAWAALFSLTLVTYFHGYIWLPNVGRLRDLPRTPLRAVRCFLAFLGGPLGSGNGLHDLLLANWIGLVVLILVCLVLLKLLRTSTENEIWRRSMPWVTLGAYSLVNAAVSTVTRGRDSPLYLLDSRYTTFSLYAMVALIFLLPILFEQKWIGVALVAAFFCLHARTFASGVGQMQALHVERLESKACFAFAKVIPNMSEAEHLTWDQNAFKAVLLLVDRAEYEHPPFVNSTDPRRLAATNIVPQQFGAIEKLTKVDSRFYRASGWARLPDAVVVSYTSKDGPPTILALADRTSEHDGTGWEQWIDIPLGTVEIQAWTYDVLTGRLFPLAGSAMVANAAAENISFEPGARPGEGGDAGEFVSANPLTIGGFAVQHALQPPRAAADRVLLTCGSGDPIVATGVPWMPRLDLGNPYRDPTLMAGWRLSVPREWLPAQGCELKAWAWTRKTHDARLLSGIRSIPPMPPFGSFDTPPTDSTLTERLGFTGWALALGGMSKVDLWREGIPGEANGMVYIGEAIRVKGSRSDVRALYTVYPDSSSSGWGYMLLKNQLPGPRTYRIHAIALDVNGNSTDLGTKTIFVR
jgi:hypothetical protein